MAQVPDDERAGARSRDRDVELLAAQLLAADAEPDSEPDAGRDLPAPPAADGLSERDLALLDFERQWWKQPGSKEQAVRETFGVSATRYYQLVNSLVEREAALRHDPMLVKRLRRARAQRLRTRTARRLGLQG
jgi:hypothetical protein